MLEIIGLRKSFDRFDAVSDANLQVAQGEIVAVIGPNGAGKTTLFRLITGQLRPNSGQILFHGRSIAGLPPHRVCRLGIGLAYQVVTLFSRLSVFQNVQTAVLAGQGRALDLFSRVANCAVDETWMILDSVGLADGADRPSGSLSHGDGKVLELAVALGCRPELLILDEPTAGMSPEETRDAIGLIRRLTKERGLTVLFCEHNIELVFSMADKIMVMQAGVTIAQGDPESVRCNELVKQAYLGGAD